MIGKSPLDQLGEISPIHKVVRFEKQIAHLRGAKRIVLVVELVEAVERSAIGLHVKRRDG